MSRKSFHAWQGARLSSRLSGLHRRRESVQCLLLQRGEIAGQTRPGGSSWQSLQRGTGDIETDYLNGEIVLLGRMHGVPTPANELLQRLARELAATRDEPGATSAATILEQLDCRASSSRARP